MHGAFFFKAACKNIGQLQLVYRGICYQAILDHEKFNLEEGWAFVEIQYSYLLAGAAVCRDAEQLQATLAQQTKTLEAAMAYRALCTIFSNLTLWPTR